MKGVQRWRSGHGFNLYYIGHLLQLVYGLPQRISLSLWSRLLPCSSHSVDAFRNWHSVAAHPKLHISSSSSIIWYYFRLTHVCLMWSSFQYMLVVNTNSGSASDPKCSMYIVVILLEGCYVSLVISMSVFMMMTSWSFHFRRYYSTNWCQVNFHSLQRIHSGIAVRYQSSNQNHWPRQEKWNNIIAYPSQIRFLSSTN